MTSGASNTESVLRVMLREAAAKLRALEKKEAARDTRRTSVHYNKGHETGLAKCRSGTLKSSQ